MSLLTNGQPRVLISAPMAPLYARQLSGQSNALTWEQLRQELVKVQPALDEIRLAAENPPNCFITDPKAHIRSLVQGTNWPKYPFVELRQAAQWLGLDTLAALNAHQRAHALTNLCTAAKLARFFHEDTTLVAAMVGIAIAGHGLAVTWEAMQHPGWTEPELARLQSEWEMFHAVTNLERGFLGERAMGALLVEEVRRVGFRESYQAMRFSSPGGPNWIPPKLLDHLQITSASLLWQLNADQDELLLLRHYQQVLESIRQLQTNQPWTQNLKAQQKALAELNQVLSNGVGLNRIRYAVCSTAIPNHTRTLQTAVRTETLRRLAISAIAIKRFELAHHRPPNSLSELVPEFLARVPNDPMSGVDLCYRIKPEATYILYSTGEDGIDNGGSTSASDSKPVTDLWSTQDAVWPTPPGP
jgi:hypothetical protein